MLMQETVLKEFSLGTGTDLACYCPRLCRLYLGSVIFKTVNGESYKYRFYIKDQTQSRVTKQLLTSISVDIIQLLTSLRLT